MSAALIAPAYAGAQAPLTDGYGSDGGVLNEVQGGGGTSPGTSNGNGNGNTSDPESRETGAGTPTGASAGGSLPFTGLDIGLLVGGGLSMLVLGVMLRRLSRSTS